MEEKLDLEVFFNLVSPTGVKLSWKFPVDDYKDPVVPEKPIKGYNILFSETISEKFIRTNRNLIDDNMFEHEFPNNNKFIRFLYKIQAVFEDDTTLDSDIVDPFPRKFRGVEFSTNFYRRELFALVSTTPQSALGAFFYQRRTSGALCPKCYIDKKKRGSGQAQGGCPVCFGTGYDKGFYKPVLGFISYETPFTQQTVYTEKRIVQEAPMMISTSGFFTVLRPKDYIREVLPPHRLFSVVDIRTRTELTNRPITFNCFCKEEEKSHPLYRLELPTFHFPDRVYFDTVFDDYARARDSVTEVPPRV